MHGAGLDGEVDAIEEAVDEVIEESAGEAGDDDSVDLTADPAFDDSGWTTASTFTAEEVGTKDGYDTIEWLADQPFCNGRVGTFGTSYPAWVQWEAAALQPPHLLAMAAFSIPTEITDLDFARADHGASAASLDEAAERLRALVPGLRAVTAHGQMDEGQLEAAMLTFMRGEADCLVATTIIESGIDIPAANTLIVERADHLGLAQAYQIRGRVGRSRERAFAYLLYPSEEAMTSEASTRLATLADHTELGSGFKIAMRDLDIRGAGNLLGDEQSGHVAAVGFELYCQLIDEAVAEMSQREDAAERAVEKEPVRLDVGVDAYLPAAYVPFEAAKIDMHRRIAGARRPGELRQISDELVDRFGAMPVEVQNLLDLQRARVSLGAAGATSVQFRGGKLSVSGVELDSESVEALSRQVEGVLYEWRDREISVRVTGDADARLAAVRALADGLSVVRMDMLPDS